MNSNYTKIFADELARLEANKTFKYEVPLESPQDGTVTVGGKNVVMLASNNYLGLANHPKINEAAKKGISEFGNGISSVRFICGTQTIHKKLEEKISKFIGTEDTILFLSCFSANEGFFASLTNEPCGFEEWKDVIYSDQFNHASIIDGQRLCNKKNTDKKVYNHGKLDELVKMLEEDKNENYRFKIIATDGVFSMEGYLAKLPELVEIAKKYGAILFVDESHALGVIGKTGKGTTEELGVFGKADVITGTLGKALGGAAGGFISGNKELVTFLRQKSRPYTFSNSLPPSLVYAASAAFDLLETDDSFVKRLKENTNYFRKEIVNLGFTILDGVHPIVPVMLGEAATAQKMSQELLKEGVYIKGLWFPVVPKGQARLRTQISAALTKNDLDRALEAFAKVGKKMDVI
ncbi:glycine C-acetyltransferase [bacterium]|nr:glycine C-acetyltransferase [bacterium]